MDLAQSLLPTAQRMADAARAAALPHFRSALACENKADAGYDPVTEADRAAERAMREVLGRDRPADAIEGEEYGAEAGTSGVTWYLDPIDGTRAFIADVRTHVEAGVAAGEDLNTVYQRVYAAIAPKYKH